MVTLALALTTLYVPGKKLKGMMLEAKNEERLLWGTSDDLKSFGLRIEMRTVICNFASSWKPHGYSSKRKNRRSIGSIWGSGKMQ